MARILALVLFICQFSITWSKKNQKLCAACHTIVDEIEYEISKVDPRKVLDIQGFRVDPTGNQKSKKVKYARSETHLTEVTETLCSRMNEYAESTNDEGITRYVLTKSRDGGPITLDNVSMGADSAERLKHMCNSLIEDNEESIIDYFKKTPKSLAAAQKEFCTEIAEVCEASDDDDDEDEKDEDEDEGKSEL